MKSSVQMLWTLPITAALAVWLTGCGSGASEPKPAGGPPTSGHSGEHAEGKHADGKHAGGEKGHHAGGHSAEEMAAAVAKLDSYADAIHELGELREEIGHLIKDDKLSDVHPPAQHIALIAKRLFELARKGGVSEEHWRDINTQSRELAGFFDEVDKAADAGKKPETEAAVTKMFKLIDSLSALAPPTEKGENEEKKTP
jgi:hypothetical protein